MFLLQNIDDNLKFIMNLDDMRKKIQVQNS